MEAYHIFHIFEYRFDHTIKQKEYEFKAFFDSKTNKLTIFEGQGMIRL